MIRLAIVGEQAAGRYARVAWRFADLACVAVAGTGPDIGAIAEQVGAGIVSDEFEQLLQQHGDEFDAVLVHGDFARRETHGQVAAEAAKHVLVEFPWTRSPLALGELCRAHNRVGMVARPWRFLPCVAIVKQQLEAGKLGQLGLVRMHRWDASGYAGSLVEERMARDLDLVCWLFDAAPTEIYGHGPPAGNSQDGNPGAGNLEDESGYAQLHLGFRGGGMAVLDYWTGLPRGDDYFSLTAIGSSGAAYADDHHDVHLVYRGGRPSACRSSQTDFAVAAQLRMFLDAIAANCPPATDGLPLREVMAAAAQSILKREMVAC